MRRLDLVWISVPLIACSQGPAPQEPLFACDFPGVQECESILHIAVGPEDFPKPNVIFQVYDLRAPEGDRLSIELINVNWTMGPEHPSEFDGREIPLNNALDPQGRGPQGYVVEDFFAEDIRIWDSTGGSVSPIYDAETRSFFVEWGLKLVSTQEPPPDPVERHEKGWARAPVIVYCRERAGESLMRHDVNFQTEFCKPWKAYSTDHR